MVNKATYGSGTFVVKENANDINEQTSIKKTNRGNSTVDR